MINKSWFLNFAAIYLLGGCSSVGPAPQEIPTPVAESAQINQGQPNAVSSSAAAEPEKMITTTVAVGSISAGKKIKNKSNLLAIASAHQYTNSKDMKVGATKAANRAPASTKRLADQTATSDFNGDGKSDILWFNTQTNQTSAWSGGKEIAVPGVNGTAVGGWQVVGTGDFDGDGRSDILWYNPQVGGMTVWSGGQPAGIPGIGATITPSSGWIIAGVGDFDGDGKSDILWFNTKTNQITAWSGGKAIAVPGVNGTANAGWQVIGIGDFDGDGKSDILWYNAQVGGVTAWSGGQSVVVPGIGATITPSSGWVIAGVGDFDGDGKSDILWFNTQTNQTSAWSGGKEIAVPGVNGVAQAGWQVIGVGDFDGDGRSDILWYNAQLGGITAWSGGQAVALPGIGATIPPSSGWVIQPSHGWTLPTPPLPISLSATSVTTSSFNVNWQSGGGSTVGYRVAIAAGTVAPNCLNGTPLTFVTSFTEASLASGTTFTIALCASNANGVLSPAATLQATTLSAGGDGDGSDGGDGGGDGTDGGGGGGDGSDGGGGGGGDGSDGGGGGDGSDGSDGSDAVRHRHKGIHSLQNKAPTAISAPANP